jgi:hypothetical protein
MLIQLKIQKLTILQLIIYFLSNKFSFSNFYLPVNIMLPL